MPNENQSSKSISNSTPEDVKQEADDLAKDLLGILDKHGAAQILPSDNLRDLMVDLSIYLVNRDHKILQHGMSLGFEKDYVVKLMKEAIAEGGLSHYLEAKMQDYVEKV